MAQFLDPLNVTLIGDSIFSIADHQFRYKSDFIPETIIVPVGFWTDFASIPRGVPLIYALLGGRAKEPAVIHDWIYYSAITDKDTADKILKEAMGICEVDGKRVYPDWMISIFYWGVRIAGGPSWNLHRKQGDPSDGRFNHTPNITEDVLQ